MMMVGRVIQVSEINLTSAFDAGYKNAALSLSQMIGRKVDFEIHHQGFHDIESSFPENDPILEQALAGQVITTEIFGEVKGKSYLLISDEEFKILTSMIPDSSGSSVNLKEEFIKELDNILSASVITKISNALQCKMYGDIPISNGRMIAKIEDMIYSDFSESAKNIYINSIQFLFDGNQTPGSAFIWVIDTESLNIERLKPS